jgi:hypothetical protein
MRSNHHSVVREAKGLAWWVAGIYLVYLATALIVARTTGQPFNQLLLTPEVGAHAWLQPAVLLFGLSGVAIALIVPAVPWVYVFARSPQVRAASVFHRAFAINLIQATAFVSAWKALAGHVPPRPSFIVWQAMISAIGLLVLWRTQRARPLRAGNRRTLLLGAAVVLVLLPTLLWGKTFVEDASGDGTEAFEFSRSLRTHQLPYWDLENGYYGFYPEFMLFAYPTQLSFIALGETEAAQRLPVFFYALGTVLVLAELVGGRRRQRSGMQIFLLLGATVYFLAYHGEHSSYEVVSDLAEPTGVDVFFTFLGTSACYELISRHRLWWGVFALFGCMALSAGPPFALLLLLGHMARGRNWRVSTLRKHVVTAAAFALPWVGYQLLVGWYSMLHPMGESKWALATLTQRYPLGLSAAVGLAVVTGLAWAIAVIPIAGLAFAARRDAIMRMLGTLVIGYVGFLAVFGRTHPHYLIPLSLFPAAMFLRRLAARDVSPRFRQGAYVLYATCLVGMAFIAFPRDRTPHTAYREFGKQTLMLYDSYPAVVEAATQVLELRPELRVHLADGKPLFPQRGGFTAADWNARAGEFPGQPVRDAEAIPWGLSHHMWVRYADAAPVRGRQYEQVIAAAHLAPAQLDGYARRDISNGWVLFCLPKSIFASVCLER